MKHFLDIIQLRTEDVEVGEGVVLRRNDDGFEVGDIISITEKYDGSNAQVAMMLDEETIEICSRKKVLDPANNLNGFYQFASKLRLDGLLPGMHVFGEWSGARNCIVYDVKNDWFVFDIYDEVTQNYLSQEAVKDFCKNNGLTYIHELYYGPFVSWEHCKSFCHSPFYGGVQEGVVVKNETARKRGEVIYRKIVNDDFKEAKSRPKNRTRQDNTRYDECYEAVTNIVTEARVRKIFNNLANDGVLKKELTTADFGLVAKLLPPAVYEDVQKEVPEVIEAYPEYIGSVCSKVAMKTFRGMFT